MGRSRPPGSRRLGRVVDHRGTTRAASRTVGRRVSPAGRPPADWPGQRRPAPVARRDRCASSLPAPHLPHAGSARDRTVRPTLTDAARFAKRRNLLKFGPSAQERRAEPGCSTIFQDSNCSRQRVVPAPVPVAHERPIPAAFQPAVKVLRWNDVVERQGIDGVESAWRTTHHERTFPPRSSDAILRPSRQLYARRWFGAEIG